MEFSAQKYPVWLCWLDQKYIQINHKPFQQAVMNFHLTVNYLIDAFSQA